jgi:enamine deaminase RidA (YjgF/YER057c/UK114 family)
MEHVESGQWRHPVECVQRRLPLVLARVDDPDRAKATVHLHHPGRDFAGFNATYERFVEAPYPARTSVGSFLGDFLVEIDAVAAIP